MTFNSSTSGDVTVGKGGLKLVGNLRCSKSKNKKVDDKKKRTLFTKAK